MRNYIKSISIFLILQLGISYSADELGVNLLEKSIRRLDGIDHTINVNLVITDKELCKLYAWMETFLINRN